METSYKLMGQTLQWKDQRSQWKSRKWSGEWRQKLQNVCSLFCSSSKYWKLRSGWESEKKREKGETNRKSRMRTKEKKSTGEGEWKSAFRGDGAKTVVLWAAACLKSQSILDSVSEIQVTARSCAAGFSNGSRRARWSSLQQDEPRSWWEADIMSRSLGVISLITCLLIRR